MAAWRWQISAKFDRVTVVSKVLSSYRFSEDEQQSWSTFALSLREEQQSELSCGITIQRERFPKKNHRGACLSWREASCQHWAFWNCFIRSLWCSGLTWVSELGSPGRIRELLAGRARLCSLKDERGLTHCSSGTVFCYRCFRGRWQDSKGRKKKGSR